MRVKPDLHDLLERVRAARTTSIPRMLFSLYNLRQKQCYVRAMYREACNASRT